MAAPQVKVVVIDAQGSRVGGAELLGPAPDADGAWLWVDVAAPDEAVLADLKARYSVPDRAFRALPSSLSAQTVHPRYHPMPDGGWLLWRSPKSIDRSTDSWQLVPATFHAVVRDNLLITMHPAAGNGSDRVKAEYGPKMLAHGPWAALRVILDVLTADASPLVEAAGDEIEAFETNVLDDDRPPGKSELAHLYDIRRILLEMQHDLGPDRDVVRSIARQLSYLKVADYHEYEDTGDQLGLLVEMIQTERDVASAAMDLYLSAQNNRMNEIMKQLTVVATIFMPLTLLSGIYGMNVAGLWPPTPARIAVQYGATKPDLYNWPFFAVVASMLVIAAAMAAWFRKKQWW